MSDAFQLRKIAQGLRDDYAESLMGNRFTDGNMIDAFADVLRNETHQGLSNEDKLAVLTLLLEME